MTLFTLFLTPPLHSYRAKNSPLRLQYLPQPFWPALCTPREFSLPSFPVPQHRSGGIFAAAAPAPRLPTFSTRPKCHPCAQTLPVFSTTTTTSTSLLHRHHNTNIICNTSKLTPSPEQQFWLPPPNRPAFGHLKGSHRTTAPTASDRVISQIASIRKNKDTLNSKPPPSLGSHSGS